MKLKILELSMQESYFIGRCQLDNKEYLLNIQSGKKIVKFPFEYDEDEVFIRISGVNVHVQDELLFKGKSKWIEVYSDIITNYLADHQHEPKWLEISSG